MASMNKVERALRPFTIPNLTSLLAICMGVVYVVGFAVPQLAEALVLSPLAVWEGQIWRLLTWIAVIPVGHNGFQAIFAFFAIYIFYLTGNVLERHWGHVRYNLYLFIFWAGTIALAMIPPYVVAVEGGYMPVWFDSRYFAMLVFFGFTMVLPDMEFLIFFILPVKVKYLAWISAALAAFTMLLNPLGDGRAIFMAFGTFLLFFGREVYVNVRYGKRKIVQRVEVARQNAVPQAQTAFHTCAVCGKTDISDPQEDFRYCPDCEGQAAYCSEHIFDHEHR